MPSTEPTVEAVGLTKQFGGFTAVDAVSVGVAAGEVFGFLGPNGSGKTTTIRMLCGILEPSGGVGRVLGRDCWRESAAVRRSLGYMSQGYALYDELTVAENLEFYGRVYELSRQEIRRRVAAFSDQMGLGAMLGLPSGQLSAGLRQRLSLGCATLHRPPIVFLDEPTSGVDPAARRDFWDLIYALAAEGTTVFVTTHHMDEAEYCHRLGLMHAGRLIALGTPAGLRTQVGGQTVEFDVDAYPPALLALGSIPRIGEVPIYGTARRVYVPPAVPTADVREALLRSGANLRAFTVLPPSLDDVFAALLG